MIFEGEQGEMLNKWEKIVLLLVIILTGCTSVKESRIVDDDTQGENTISENIMDYSIDHITGSAATGSDVMDVDNNKLSDRSSNSFFDGSNFKSLKYKGKFSNEEGILIEKEVYIQVEKIADLKEGILYKLEIEQINGVPKNRLILGMFYVQNNNRIYRIAYTGENKDTLIREQKIPLGSSIICQEKGIKDRLNQEQKGEHQYLLVQGDIREYHSYNNQVESGYYETYIWERNIGLKYYKSGYGAEKDLVELECINK